MSEENKILIIDDDFSLRRVIAKALSNSKTHVSSVGTLSEAWVLIEKQSFDLIISDVVLGFPLGVNALSLLFVAGVAAYVRVVTVRITLINDWISFIPALLLAIVSINRSDLFSCISFSQLFCPN